MGILDKVKELNDSPLKVTCGRHGTPSEEVEAKKHFEEHLSELKKKVEG